MQKYTVYYMFRDEPVITIYMTNGGLTIFYNYSLVLIEYIV